MGLFGKLFGGGEKEYPALDPASSGAQGLEKFRSQVEVLVKKINDRYEAVTAQNAVYVFVGDPSGTFGMAWFLEGDSEEHNLKKLIQKRGLSQKEIDGLVLKLRTAHSERENEPRYSALVAGRKVIVTPSNDFANSLHSIVHFIDE